MKKDSKILIFTLVGMFIVTISAMVIASWFEQNFIVTEEPVDTRLEKELSYYIDRPEKILDVSSVREMGNVSILVNGNETSQLCSVWVRIWNSGKESLTNIPIKYMFSPHDSSEELSDIISVTHETDPEQEFGDIIEDKSASSIDSKRFIYPLLNSDDVVTVTFLTYNKTKVEIYTHVEGLNFKEGSFYDVYPSVFAQPSSYNIVLWPMFFIFIPIIIMLTGIIWIIIGYIKSRREKYLEEIFKNKKSIVLDKAVADDLGKIYDEYLQKQLLDDVKNKDKIKKK